jgi:excisionase family DNA binding protein
VATEPGERVALFTVPELAAVLSISTSGCWKRVHDGSIPVIRIGRSVRISPAVVNKLLRGEQP